MALDQTVQVDLPKHGIAYKKISGKTYVYYVTAAYRNEKGKPTNERVSIGRLDEETGKLIPNRNYYETYLKKPMPVTAGIQDFGVWDVFEKVCKKLGVTTLLRKYFPENAKEMLTAAQYILSEGNVMYCLDEYTQSHQTAGKGRMSNEQCSKTFASLRQEDMQLFFREWMKHKKQTEYVAYDVTSISSYSQNIREVEWGYNRDKERLPQINMGMYYGEESCLPLYYRVYPGSISTSHRIAQTKKIPLPAAKNCREGDNFLTCLQLACNLLVAAQKAKKASRNYFYFGNGSQSACRQLARSVQFA